MTASTPSLGVLRVRDTLLQWGSRTYVMGIINMTPDSFSGDGLAVDARAAAAQAKRFVEEARTSWTLAESPPAPAYAY